MLITALILHSILYHYLSLALNNGIHYMTYTHLAPMCIFSVQ